MNPHAVTAYIALGSNLGDRGGNIRSAIDALNSTPGTRVIRVSTFLENPAVGGPADSPDFLNAVAQIETALGSHDLLHRLLDIEHSQGRQRRQKWEPRIIDLDVLLYGEEIIASEELTIPHPLMHTRSFVLKPLVELAPDLIHPTLGVSISQLLANL